MGQKFKNQVKALAESLKDIKRSGTAKIIAITNVRETKKNRTTKELAPEWLIGLRRVTMSVINIGHDYTTAVKNQIEKAGCDPDAWKTQKGNNVPVEGYHNGCYRQGIDKDGNLKDSFYVRIFTGMIKSKAYEEHFITLDGVIVTNKITPDIIADYFPLKYSAEKQAKHGSGKEVSPRDYKVESIRYLQKGDAVYNILSKDLIKLLDLTPVE